ncbi:hypothetical protein R3P38DRAFT_3176539 [Favolaschia claudopus]|uniref:Uncharacterized protein n=1 Tax=Favolaschia claudopus TaxID=2862362 RepID=A0AAW0D415_9AGAR
MQVSTLQILCSIPFTRLEIMSVDANASDTPKLAESCPFNAVKITIPEFSTSYGLRPAAEFASNGVSLVGLSDLKMLEIVEEKYIDWQTLSLATRQSIKFYDVHLWDSPGINLSLSPTSPSSKLSSPAKPGPPSAALSGLSPTLSPPYNPSKPLS